MLFTPVHIVFLELVIDPACSIAFEMEPADPRSMERPPRSPAARLMGRRRSSGAWPRGWRCSRWSRSGSGLACRSTEALTDARTLAFSGLLLGNLGLIVAHRAHASGLLRSFRVPNPAFWAVLGGAIGVLTLVLALPPLRRVFQFGPLHLDDLAISAGAHRRAGRPAGAHRRAGDPRRGDRHEDLAEGPGGRAGAGRRGAALAQSGARPLDDSQPPELTPDDGRAALRRRMSRHGAMLDALVVSALRLDHPKVAELAGALERDTGLGAWPGPDAGVAARDAPWSAWRPSCAPGARTLADVARRGADAELPAAFGGLMETCVQCHRRALARRPRTGHRPALGATAPTRAVRAAPGWLCALRRRRQRASSLP